MELNLQSLRHEIDRLDNGLLQMLQKRLEVARLVIKFKKELHQDVNVPAREQAILDSLKGRERSLLTAEFIEEIYSRIFTESKRLQRESSPLIAFQGEHGAYSEVAARLWNSDITPIPCTEFYEVFEGVAGGSYDYGIVPMENLLGVVLNQMNTYLLNNHLYIVGAVEMRVKHALLIVPGVNFGALRWVYSHPLALAECTDFTQRMNLEPMSYYDTAGAAKMLAETWKESSAVIASDLAARYYNLEVLRNDIGDKQTATRFVVVSRSPASQPGHKCTISFVLPNRAGTLAEILQLFAERQINMTHLNSLPDENGNSVFFADFEASNEDAPVREILNVIQEKSITYQFLGCYDEMKEETL